MNANSQSIQLFKGEAQAFPGANASGAPGSLKQGSSTKLKNIYQNSSFQKSGNNSSTNQGLNGNNNMQKKMMIKNSNQFRSSYNSISGINNTN